MAASKQSLDGLPSLWAESGASDPGDSLLSPLSSSDPVQTQSAHDQVFEDLAAEPDQGSVRGDVLTVNDDFTSWKTGPAPSSLSIDAVLSDDETDVVTRPTGEDRLFAADDDIVMDLPNKSGKEKKVIRERDVCQPARPDDPGCLKQAGNA